MSRFIIKLPVTEKEGAIYLTMSLGSSEIDGERVDLNMSGDGLIVYYHQKTYLIAFDAIMTSLMGVLTGRDERVELEEIIDEPEE